MGSGRELIEIKENKSIEEILQEEINFEPYTDIYETDYEYFLVANMPGVSRSGIRVKIENESLIIFGKVNINDLSGRKYILKETETGNYYRKFRISENIETGDRKSVV